MQNKVSHAYILSGETGSGKKSLARAFAWTLLCEKGGPEPCGECPSCRRVMSGNHPDLISVSHEKPASIGVDEVREQINNAVVIRPYNGGRKIFIVDEAEKLTVQAQNALLKTIEEPPSYAVIMLLTENADALLPTITSRCVHLRLLPLPDQQVRDYLEENYGLLRQEAEVYAAFARGNLGRAIRLCTSEEFKLLYREVLQLVRQVKNLDISDLLETVRRFKEEKLDYGECLDFMLLWYRDVLYYKVTKDMNRLVFKDEYRAISEAGKNSGYDGLEHILEAIDKAKVRLNANVNSELTWELLLLVMREN